LTDTGRSQWKRKPDRDWNLYTTITGPSSIHVTMEKKTR
jgi:hypothetical protein